MRGFSFETESGCKYLYDDETGYILPLTNDDDITKYEEKYKEL